MSIKYEVVPLIPSSNIAALDLSVVRRTLKEAYEEVYHTASDKSKGSQGDSTIFYIYLIDAEDEGTQDYLNHLLTISPEQRPPKLQSTQENYGMFFFLSKSESFNSWSDGDNVAGHKRLKNSEFYIRLFVSYQLGKFVPCKSGGQGDYGLGELKTRLRRLVYEHARRGFDDRTKTVLEILNSIREDADSLYYIAEEGRHVLQTQYLNQKKDSTEVSAAASSEQLGEFLRTLNSLYQLGRRPHRDSEENTRKIHWLEKYGGSYKIQEQINQELQKERPDASSVVELQLLLRRYEIYRDLARWLASGARHWIEKLPVLNILIIDEELDSVSRQTPSLEGRLKNIHHALRGKTEIRVARIRSPFWLYLNEYLGGMGELKCERHPSFEAGEASKLLEMPKSLTDYHLIIMEVEFSKAHIGPTLVQKLGEHFDQIKEEQHRPGIIVLSRQQNLPIIQQCLNLGAETYVKKDRIYALPARIAQVRLPRKPTEPRGRRSNFRSLYRLRQENLVKLYDKRINGYPWDEIERKWLKSLPKADLHTHIGTCIRLQTIEALAFNTSGYLLSNGVKLKQGEQIQAEGMNLKSVQELVKRICAIVILAGVLNKLDTRQKKYAPAKLLWTAAIAVLQMDKALDRNDARAKEFPEHDVYDTLINKRLLRKEWQIEAFEVCSLLVAAMCLAGGTYEKEGLFLESDRMYLQQVKSRVVEQWDYLQKLHLWWQERKGQDDWVNTLLKGTAQHCRIITGSAWGRSLTRNWCQKNFALKEEESWLQCFKMVSLRVRTATEQLNEYFKAALQSLKTNISRLAKHDELLVDYFDEVKDVFAKMVWPTASEDLFEMPPLTEFVKIPDIEKVKTKDQTLQRYLVGAQLLGADHLQYPENLLLAARDIVEQAVEDNIRYSEIRCATNGYCKGGMSAIDATNLLCSSFDIATVYTAMKEKKRWVRVNILLGAKRHKSNQEFRSIVSLLSSYLERREKSVHQGFEQVSGGHTFPEWWKPCWVVGFDLSGDETSRSDGFQEMIEPLLKLSAPITIHAGEAASAESIWTAVYRFGARRIGHGLRLRDDVALLNYCVKEGVCMEMCPTSNQYTNGFSEPKRRQEYDGSLRDYYPLRFNMEAGLDVCINTDNRQLHAGQTLTDDYMCAARLTGGLTKWEILKLVKAGFKHAFLLKSDVEVLLTAMEHEVYNLVVDKKGELPDEDIHTK